jgi:hypothetical protein
MRSCEWSDVPLLAKSCENLGPFLTTFPLHRLRTTNPRWGSRLGGWRLVDVNLALYLAIWHPTQTLEPFSSSAVIPLAMVSGIVI